ncbi:hypothetical protein JOF56_003685 [Kibdelosporangium banguiense]|uniref:Uncharacterized protein n=1 Tax=Kibdelosporangium banguiense TaxID=1365924 RepID=A0ABS4TGY7_9PSEU|nr:hypothetical protein [Kibdelosporangium banguiense]MBP2323300.1 hypothetical protein [Kibdelosporangium banguiense]
MTYPPALITLLDPDEARKAASFVKAIAEIEAKYVLDHVPGGIRIGGLTAPYVLARESNQHPLTLALETRTEQLRTDAPTVADIKADPKYWISGPGRDVASRTKCPHEYRLTDSCPNCDADLELADAKATQRW